MGPTVGILKKHSRPGPFSTLAALDGSVVKKGGQLHISLIGLRKTHPVGRCWDLKWFCFCCSLHPFCLMIFFWISLDHAAVLRRTAANQFLSRRETRLIFPDSVPWRANEVWRKRTRLPQCFGVGKKNPPNRMGPPWTGKGRFACWNCFLLGDFFEGIVLVHACTMGNQSPFFYGLGDLYTYIPGTLWWPLFCCKLGHCFGGFNPKNRGWTGSRYFFPTTLLIQQISKVPKFVCFFIQVEDVKIQGILEWPLQPG